MTGKWVVYKNVDMCGQGDVSILHDWRTNTSIDAMRKTVEGQCWSAVTVGSFGHAALKSFDYQLTKKHCKPSKGYTNEIHVYYPNGNAPKDGVNPSEMSVGVSPGSSSTAMAMQGGNWTSYNNIDMCRQGDVDIILDWKRHMSIDDLKRIVEERGYSAFTVSNGSPSFGHAALKKFPFALTPEHCKPISSCCRHPCTIYIYTPPGGGAKAPDVSRLSLGTTPSHGNPASTNALNKGCELTFSTATKEAFDQRGILYNIGTNFGTEGYVNPADSKRVVLKWSSDAANYYSTQGGHKVGDARQAGSIICAHDHPGYNATMWSKGAAGAWFAIDLKTISLMPTHFSYRNDYGGGGNHPRTFELQGSADGANWTCLSQHSRESWPGVGVKHWPIVSSTYYSQFRVLNKGAPNHLCCSGIEFYGYVARGPSGVKEAAQAVVMGTLVAPAGGTSTAPDPNNVLPSMGVPPTKNSNAPPLVEIVNELKRQLGLGKNGESMIEVVDAGCLELGLPTEGKSMVEKAAAAWKLLHG